MYVVMLVYQRVNCIQPQLFSMLWPVSSHVLNGRQNPHDTQRESSTNGPPDSLPQKGPKLKDLEVHIGLKVLMFDPYPYHLETNS